MHIVLLCKFNKTQSIFSERLAKLPTCSSNLCYKALPTAKDIAPKMFALIRNKEDIENNLQVFKLVSQRECSIRYSNNFVMAQVPEKNIFVSE